MGSGGASEDESATSDDDESGSSAISGDTGSDTGDQLSETTSQEGSFVYGEVVGKSRAAKRQATATNARGSKYLDLAKDERFLSSRAAATTPAKATQKRGPHNPFMSALPIPALSPLEPVWCEIHATPAVLRSNRAGATTSSMVEAARPEAPKELEACGGAAIQVVARLKGDIAFYVKRRYRLACHVFMTDFRPQQGLRRKKVQSREQGAGADTWTPGDEPSPTGADEVTAEVAGSTTAMLFNSLTRFLKCVRRVAMDRALFAVLQAQVNRSLTCRTSLRLSLCDQLLRRRLSGWDSNRCRQRLSGYLRAKAHRRSSGSSFLHLCPTCPP